MNYLSKNEFETSAKISNEGHRQDSYMKQVVKLDTTLTNLKVINIKVEDHVYLNIMDCNVKKDHTYTLENNEKQLRIRLILEGNFFKVDKNAEKIHSYEENHITLEYNENQDTSLFYEKDTSLKYLCITLREDYLKENSFLYDILEKKLNNDFIVDIYEPELKARYSELFRREYESKVDKIYLKNKTMDLIFFAFDKLEKQKELNSNLNKEDINRIKKAKEIIETSFSKKITIPSLSKEVAVNQSKLKKGFKELFGYRIHEYLIQVRLIEAIKLLKSKNYSVKEVSLMVGYTNQGSFTYAFSKKYNCSPKEIIKTTT